MGGLSAAKPTLDLGAVNIRRWVLLSLPSYGRKLRNHHSKPARFDYNGCNIDRSGGEES